MSWSFNVFSGTLDQVGSSGAVVFEGEVETFTDLPEVVGDPPVGSSFLVRSSTGVWLVNRRQAGIWIRRNNTGVRATDWEYGGDYPVNSVNGQTGNVSLSKSDVGLGNVDNTSDANKPISTATQTALDGKAASVHTHTASQISDSTATGRSVLTATDAAAARSAISAQVAGSYAAASHAHAASDVTSGTFDNARINFAAPDAIGSTTRNTGAFTTLNATNGTLTASAPVLDLSQTWNNAAVAFTGLRFNVTNTASLGTGMNSRLFEINLDGNPIYRFQRNSSTPCLFFGATDTGIGTSNTFLTVFANGGAMAQFNSGSGGIQIRSDATYAWSSTTTVSSATDLILSKDAADTLAQRRTTNPQTFRIYNTFTDASNFERGFMRWSSNVLQIGTEKGGTGSARALEFQTDGTTRLTIGATTGTVVCSGSLSVVANVTFQGNSSIVGNIASGVLRLVNNTATDFDRLQFGGGTSSFPALKRSSTTLQVRLADDSADAPLSASLFSVGSGAFDGVIGRPNAGVIGFARADGATTYIAALGFDGTTRALVANSGAFIGWSSGNASSVASGDTRLWRDAAGVIAQYNGVNAQAYRLYNTFISTTSFERLNVRWASNECIIDAEAGSGGGTLRGIKIGSATSSLLGFYGATPVDRPATVADPTGGGTVDAEARTAINDIIDRLQELGLIA